MPYFTFNQNCIKTDVCLLALRKTGYWKGTQQVTLEPHKIKHTGKVVLKMIGHTDYLSTRDIRECENVHHMNYVTHLTPLYQIGQDDFGDALYSIRKPA